jgi:4-hydroxy-4-methyl-2-oxoglutarate aldolase
MDEASKSARAHQLSQLGTALVCDVLDSMDQRHSFMGPSVVAAWPCGPVAGTAVTLTCEPIDELVDEPYGVLFEALSKQRSGSVLVIGAGDRWSGVWGELLTTAARARGIVGVVTDGLTRDLSAIADLGFPLYAAGVSPLDSAGRQTFARLDVPVTIGDATWVLADELGAVAVPAALIDEVIERGMAKMAAESTVRAELVAGDDLGDVFRRHGVL